MDYGKLSVDELITLSDDLYEQVANELGSSGADMLNDLIKVEKELAKLESEDN